jgi:hypothetical protein
MCTELQRIETDACDPITDQPCILSRRQATFNTASSSEQELPWAPARNTKMLVDCLTRLLGQLETHRAPSFLLANRRTVEGVAIGGHVVDADSHHVTATQLAVDGEVEESQIA